MKPKKADIGERLRGPGIEDYELDLGVAADAALEIGNLRARLAADTKDSMKPKTQAGKASAKLNRLPPLQCSAMVGPLKACIRLERLLRHHPDVYHICLDYPQPYDLGKWLNRVIRNAKRHNAEVSSQREHAQRKGQARRT
jgi:hypothetical protein